MAVDCGKCGIFPYGIFVELANSSAKAPRPEPSTRAMRGRSFVFEKTDFAACSARSNSSFQAAFFLVAIEECFALGKHADDRGGHQVGHSAGKHGADAELRELAAALRSERADAANLNADGAEVRKATKRESGDGEGSRIERALQRSELLERNKLIDDHARPKKISDVFTIVPGDADHPGNGSKEPAKDLLEACGKPRDVIMAPTHHGIEESEKGEKGNQHGADIERQVQAVNSAAGDSAKNVGLFFHLRHLDAAGGERLFRFWDEHLGHEERAGRRHDYRGEEVLRFNAEGDVSRHDAAGDVGHAAGYDAHQFGFRELVEEGADGERGFGLAHEDAGGDVEGFRAAGSHDAGHDPGGDSNDNLHHADVIKESEKSSDKDDCRKYLKGKGKTEGRNFLADFTEDKFRADVRIAEKFVNVKTCGFENASANFELQNEEGK